MEAYEVIRPSGSGSYRRAVATLARVDMIIAHQLGSRWENGTYEDGEEDRKHNLVTRRENRTRDKQDDNEDVREIIEPRKSQYSILDKTSSFISTLIELFLAPRRAYTPEIGRAHV